MLPPPWSDYRHHGRFYNSLLSFKLTSYTPYLAGSAAYLVGLITLYFLALLLLSCIIFNYHCITVLPLPTPCPLPPLWYQSHSFLAGDSVVVFSVSPSVSTRNFGVQLLCPLLTVVGATLVVK